MPQRVEHKYLHFCFESIHNETVHLYSHVLQVFICKAMNWTIFWPHDGTTWKVRSSPKWFQFLQRGTWISVTQFDGNSSYNCWDISPGNTNVNLLVAPKENPGDQPKLSLRNCKDISWNISESFKLLVSGCIVTVRHLKLPNKAHRRAGVKILTKEKANIQDTWYKLFILCFLRIH